ncbi:hypothetical protein D5086_011910 [Populus alba]|uniref:Uncharacterized protein n=1 Tax=Populus alba TaxID=43335 RepID=A0ACC4C181_POPAL
MVNGPGDSERSRDGFSQTLNFRQPQAVVTPPAPPPQLQAQQQHRQTHRACQNAGVVTNEVAKERPLVGEPALPRTEIVKQLWQYIRKNNLQDPSNKRKIICDDALQESSQAKRAKVDVETPTENTEPGASLVVISERLAEFFGDY